MPFLISLYLDKSIGAGTAVGMPRHNVHLFRACYPAKSGSVSTGGARWRNREEHPRTECQEEPVVLKREVGFLGAVVTQLAAPGE